MVALVKIFGIAMAGMGVAFLVNPKLYGQYVAFWNKKKRIKSGGILAIVVGGIFLNAASGCKVSGVVLVMGILALVKGIFLLTAGQNKVKAVMDWWQGKPVSTLRIMAVIAIAIGALLFFSA